jgi:transketolase
MVNEALDTTALARRIRAHSLEMIYAAKASHIGSCLSMADLLAVLYGRFLRVDPARPQAMGRDRFILSKGHGAAIAYAVLAECGFFPVAELAQYCRDGSRLTGHISHSVEGVELSTGSLGHGLSVGAGMALAAKRRADGSRVVVLASDGEMDEGSNWEAVLFAPHHQLDNLTLIIDYNKIQSFGSVEAVLALEPFVDKLRSFRWSVREIDGHDHAEIARALDGVPFDRGTPSVIVAHTIKGKGISFMENDLRWHYSSPDAVQFEAARAELSLR